MVIGAINIPRSLASGQHAAATIGTVPPGCSAQRVAVAYHSDGSAAPQSAAPVTCAYTTGFGSSETRIKVSPSGTVVVEPAVTSQYVFQGIVAPTQEPVTSQPAGLAVSSSNGQKWSLDLPAGQTMDAADNTIYIDRTTGRLFVYSYGLPSPSGRQTLPRLLSSPASRDGYTSWSSNDFPGISPENARFTSAPPPKGQPLPVPGETVAYWCANYPQYNVRLCYRSLDGGATWQYQSILFTSPVPQHSECGTNGENFGALDGNYPEGGPDGSLWVLVDCGSTTFLAKSTDEGTTWPIPKNASGNPITVPFSPPAGGATNVAASFGHHELRVDSAGNLYAAEVNGSSLIVHVSTDGGQHWNAPLNMTAPAARKAALGEWSFAVGYKPGEVAAAYLVPRTDSGDDGYVAMSNDVFAANPTFYSSTINPSDKPMFTTAAIAADFIEVDLGPDGNPWGSFYADCPTDGSNADCSSTVNTSGRSYASMVGRLFQVTTQ